MYALLEWSAVIGFGYLAGNIHFVGMTTPEHDLFKAINSSDIRVAIGLIRNVVNER